MSSYPPTLNSQSSRTDYTDQQNTTFGYWNAKGQFLFGTPSLSGEYVSPASQPHFPVRGSGDASEIRRNQENRTVFNALNAHQQQVPHNRRSHNNPIFKSHQDMLKYIQGQYTQPQPGTTNQTLYTAANLFP